MTTAQAYDPYKNKWRVLPALPGPLGFSGGAVAYGLIFLEGGYNGAASITTNQYTAIGPAIP